MHVCDIRFFETFCFKVGTLIKLDESTINKERFDFARVLVSAPYLKDLNQIFQVNIDNTVFNIRVVEELEWTINEGTWEGDDEESENDDTRSQWSDEGKKENSNGPAAAIVYSRNSMIVEEEQISNEVNWNPKHRIETKNKGGTRVSANRPHVQRILNRSSSDEDELDLLNISDNLEPTLLEVGIGLDNNDQGISQIINLGPSKDAGSLGPKLNHIGEIENATGAQKNLEKKGSDQDFCPSPNKSSEPYVGYNNTENPPPSKLINQAAGPIHFSGSISSQNKSAQNSDSQSVKIGLQKGKLTKKKGNPSRAELKKAEVKAFSNFVEEMKGSEDRERRSEPLPVNTQSKNQHTKQDRELEAQRTWKLGKELGLITNQSDAEITNCLVDMEVRVEETAIKDKERKVVVS